MRPKRLGVYNLQFLVWLEDALCSGEQRRNWLDLYPGNSLYIRLGKNCGRAFFDKVAKRGIWRVLKPVKPFSRFFFFLTWVWFSSSQGGERVHKGRDYLIFFLTSIYYYEFSFLTSMLCSRKRIILNFYRGDSHPLLNWHHWTWW